MIKPRDYQTRTIERLRVRFAAGFRRLLVVAPTGSGKTVIAALMICMALEKGRRTLFLAHRRELIKQAWCKLVRSGVDPSQIGVILPDMPYPRGSTIPLGGYDSLTDDELWDRYAARNPSAPVQVASVQTLIRREIPATDLIIIDEAHRARAASYTTIVERAGDVPVVGLTATPLRTDGKSLGSFFEELVVVAQYAELVEAGHLVPCSRAWSHQSLPDVSGVKVKGGDYDLAELGKVCNTNVLVGDIVEHYKRRGNDAPAFCFAAGVEHSRDIAARFNEAGISAAHVDGETPTAERDRILGGLRDGSIRVVVNCDVCTEGTDVPCVKTIILARPTRSLRVYLQMVGRGSRPFGEKPFVILDHAGIVNQAGFGYPENHREWSLNPPKRKSKMAGSPPVRTCEGCYAMYPLSCTECPECGLAPPPPPPRTIREVQGELKEVPRPSNPTEAKRIFDLCCEQWRLENEARDVPLSPGWIAYRYKEIAGSYPSRFTLPSFTPEQWSVYQRYQTLRDIEVKECKPRGWARGQIKAEIGGYQGEARQ